MRVRVGLDKPLAIPGAILVSSLPTAILLSLIRTPVLVLIRRLPFSIELVYISIQGYGLLGSLHQSRIVVWSGGAETFLSDASWESFEEFHED